ncbi:hypothetical protein [Actinomadura parmotrematis]|uniref:DUF3291 domain-containing protein n=1 Tax=Actinomadura parmotrematis TaxID=2864039 RepID=A0ABS7G183_9ACTN|nr:hypothetical protein [Actinomadura parmotrematis]MBW8486469.1 hypothetical protein [Actinomadura parmotrematis]
MEIPWTRVGGGGSADGADAVVMASRFELASAWRSPVFLLHSLRLWRQARRAPGALGVALRAAPLSGVFWTLSAWQDRAALARYARTDPHGRVLAAVRPWTRSADFVYWETPIGGLPAGPGDAGALWEEGERRVSARRGA